MNLNEVEKKLTEMQTTLMLILEIIVKSYQENEFYLNENLEELLGRAEKEAIRLRIINGGLSKKK